MAAMKFIAPTVLFLLAVSLSLWSPNSPGKMDKQAKENKIDILLATETHLSSHVNSCEILPQNFLVYRKDRPSHKGGVLIAVNNNLVSIPRPDLDSDCEIIWCEVLLEKESILLGYYYRQESKGMDSLDALEVSLSKVVQSAGNRHIILTGDFNLPSIDWVTSNVPSGAKDVNLCKRLLDIAHDFHLEQFGLFIKT
ncbi:predicted protein [Nematostella vectensis]|uniref:Endonuclease/exonuclease/phosphatase domain-containing protein n=1 Tax=Nematostella vectensis TaxID=45351 RepID=A7SMJ0_NEMVE|nr:predicted protein [Nematostella vectensis]|eukprot:XP_001627165.1 predicted protein [Nematostella vectensis]